MGRGDARPGDFDVYLLAQSWAPSFCCSSPDKCTTVSWAFSATHMSLHGLWPGYQKPKEGGRTYPSDCSSTARLDVSQLPRNFVDYAPSYCAYDAAKHKALLGSLGVHEWRKHGTCSGLPPQRYFGEAVRAMDALAGPSGEPMGRGTPRVVKENIGSAVAEVQLRASYARAVAIRVDSGCQLQEVTSCWQKNDDSTVGEQIHCPDYVMKGPRNNVSGAGCDRVHITMLGKCLKRARTKK